MLTRELIESGHYAEKLGVPADLLWTQDRIDASLHEPRLQRPAGTDDGIWVFAYGSLLWNPLFAAAHEVPAMLAGWHRSFSLRITTVRATALAPGRMLALDTGGTTHG